jgi:hypothetical protein
MHQTRIIRSRLIRIVTFVIPVGSPEVVAGVVVRRVQWRAIEVFRRFILEGEAWDEAWRRWRDGAIDFFVLSTTQKKAASKKDSGSSKDAERYSDTESNLLCLRESIVAR